MSQSTTPETDVQAYRPEVVRRLLARGVSAQTLALVLPGWEQLVDETRPLRTTDPA